MLLDIANERVVPVQRIGTPWKCVRIAESSNQLSPTDTEFKSEFLF